MADRAGVLPGPTVYTVHATLPNEVRPTQAIYSDQRHAFAYATELSKDEGVLATSVVRFTVDELGTRTNIAMFVNGKRQTVPYVSDCRTVHGGGRKYLSGQGGRGDRV